MARGRSSRKSDQKGVEAIFSSPRDRGHDRFILGGVALFVGAFSLIVSMMMLQFPQLLDRSALALYGALGFASVGVFIVTCGGGIILTARRFSRLPSSRASIGQDVLRSFSTTREIGNASQSSAISSPALKLRLTVFLQGIILLSLYTGLVEEYQSNATMQQWVHSSLDGAQYLLGYEAVLVSSVLLGVLVVYSFVSRDLIK